MLFSFRHWLDRTLFNICNINQQHHYIWLQFRRDETQQPRQRQALNVGCDFFGQLLIFKSFILTKLSYVCICKTKRKWINILKSFF